MNIVLIGITIFVIAPATAQNYLNQCWEKQASPLQKEHVTFSYKENFNKLQHSYEPWQQTSYNSTGSIWSSTDIFQKQDTITGGRKTYYSKSKLTNSILLFLDYGDSELFTVTNGMFYEETFKSARYIPTNIIEHFKQKNISINSESNNKFAVYKTIIHKTIVTLYIRKSDYLLCKVSMLSDDDLFGDVTTTFEYTNYKKLSKLYIPQNIQIEKVNGKIKDSVLLSNIQLTKNIPQILVMPSDYKLVDSEESKPVIKVSKYSENIHFIALKHTDDKIMIVEFKDFLLVAEAPINSENGELIVAEANKIAPNKPIRYFVFGHYHPHYLGGLRAFVHQGAKIICSDITREYVQYIANAPHTLNPDKLQKEPRSLKIEHIKDSLTISDGEYDMKIYFIGGKSYHTKGYLIYYFPSEKLLFQDDLIWIKREGEIKKAGKRQAGLYNAIKGLNLDVKTIIQSWPVADHGVKTIIPFGDLEKSMHIE